MKIKCFTRPDDEEPAEIIECTEFVTQTHSPHHHEVVAQGGVVRGAMTYDELLVQVEAADRSHTSPLRFGRIVVESDEGEVLWDKDVSGSAGVDRAVPDATEAHDAALEDDTTDNEGTGEEDDGESDITDEVPPVLR
jgi:hypothetical protein